MASLTEKEGLITFLQEELREVREKKAVHEVRLLLQTPGFSVETASLLIAFSMVSSIVLAEHYGRTVSFSG